MSQGLDLSHFVQHRQLDAYHQSMARRSYAYGVDLRRSRWLAGSTLGNAVVRAVDRAWPRLSAHLMDESFTEARGAPTELLAEVAAHMSLLQAPLPTLRLLRPSARGRWPLVTPLGATRGGSGWLVLDAEALLALDPDVRSFLLGAGLGHLHCDHAVFFSAYLLASRSNDDPEARESGVRVRMVRSVLSPWTRLNAFSADRAGLLCCGKLEPAIRVIESPPVAVGEGAVHVHDWLPPLPETAMRVRALQEFAQSVIFARVSAMRARQRELRGDPSRGSEFLSKGSAPQFSSSGAAPGSSSSGSAFGLSSRGSAPELEPLLRPSTLEASDAKATPSESQLGGPTLSDVHVPADAWSLARVDARLTARLRLL